MTIQDEFKIIKLQKAIKYDSESISVILSDNKITTSNMAEVKKLLVIMNKYTQEITALLEGE